MSFPVRGATGGQKMICRHVETLRDLGFDAIVRRNVEVEDNFPHHAPVEINTPFHPDDVVVLPTDARNIVPQAAALKNRVIMFCQGHLEFAATASLDAVRESRIREFIAISPAAAKSVQRALPDATVSVVPAFADERVFRPLEKLHQIAHAPWKRPVETAAIWALFRNYHPRHAQTAWARIEKATEEQVAQAMGRSSLFLSLSKMEGLGLTPLEAMASGCVVAGFKGIGGRDFATPENGFWVPDEDCEAAADALAEACDVFLTGGAALKARLEAGYETARHWSYARFCEALEAFWSPKVSRRPASLTM
ncbi:glycosyltransferase [Phenylobacterium sp.]|uniref:glycosyltransferase n=1 Tax=Phenylobacterium sp. TaxID=1871053 RepID=UPI002E379E6B|nr:glycosyltransferase [Phenylobacterium sp.]HEX2559108.1 glycosyltransferase [Phenylobacterium sp.]